VWLFGSRSRKQNRADSDIDLALEMTPTEHDDAYNVWWNWHERYQQSPDLQLSHPADLHWYERDAGLERVAPGVEQHGVKLYERS
jgi:predicted nucleotidyltransferase